MSLFVLVFFYSQAASKAGFVLSPAAGKKGDFQALKLGQIDITVRATGGVNLLTSLKVFFISYDHRLLSTISVRYPGSL